VPSNKHNTNPNQKPKRVFLTGATGYIGGRLGPSLLEEGHELVCLARDPRKLEMRAWSHGPRVHIVKGDLDNPEPLTEAMAGCDAAYYLVHSMEGGTQSFAERDRTLAHAFAAATREARVKRIIYLGGLGEINNDLSEHLRSRREVETILRESGVPLTAFRAAMIIGSGSASFEILRYLTERLPVMVTPRWVKTECQPIAVADVLHYLARCLDNEVTTDKSLEIGGTEILTYQQLLQEMAAQLGLRKRFIVPVPVLTPKLSSYWIGFVTPVSPAVGRPLAEGLRNRVVVTDDTASRIMPHEPLSPKQAIARALERTNDAQVPTRWTAAGVIPGDPDWAGGRVFQDQRHIDIDASPRETYAAVCRVGGGHGWYAAGQLWKLRGLMDQLVGGPGVRRGRRHPEQVEYGDALDFWRVIDVKPDQRLGLLAEMKVPGVAGLSFDIEPKSGGARSKLTMTARFRPKGLPGLAYWYAVLPFHSIVFKGMLKGMRRAAEAMVEGKEAPPTHA